MLNEISEKLAARSGDLEDWYQNRLKAIPGGEPPLYSSVDIRNAGYKIGVVDTNLFPAGFNNLCETFRENGTHAFRRFFQRWHPSVQKILIVPEEHTRNLFYWKSIAALRQMLTDAGLSVQVGSASTLFPQDPFVISLEEADPVFVRKVSLKDGFLRTSDFVPDLILLNNDLSSGTPDYLQDVRQLSLPSPALGWYRRRKSDHFENYQKLIEEVGEILSLDPWRLAPLTTVETGIDLTDEICLKRLQNASDSLLSRIRQKYLQYGIGREPYLFIKNNSGTYGLGVTHITSGSQLLSLSRRLRNKLESAKGGQRISEYLLQEGIPTADAHQGKPLEPVVYLVGGETVGTFFRIHQEKNEMENLNAPGMSFTCLCFHKKPDADLLFTIGSFLGKVASLAAVLELNDAVKRFSPCRIAS